MLVRAFLGQKPRRLVFLRRGKYACILITAQIIVVGRKLHGIHGQGMFVVIVLIVSVPS